MQYLQCFSNGDTAVLHETIDMKDFVHTAAMTGGYLSKDKNCGMQQKQVAFSRISLCIQRLLYAHSITGKYGT